jgi:hypothetical protein
MKAGEQDKNFVLFALILLPTDWIGIACRGSDNRSTLASSMVASADIGALSG